MSEFCKYFDNFFTFRYFLNKNLLSLHKVFCVNVIIVTYLSRFPKFSLDFHSPRSFSSQVRTAQNFSSRKNFELFGIHQSQRTEPIEAFQRFILPRGMPVKCVKLR